LLCIKGERERLCMRVARSEKKMHAVGDDVTRSRVLEAMQVSGFFQSGHAG